MSADTEGASPNERLLAAAKEDDVDMFEEVVEGGHFDINHADGLGMTALHYAAARGSVDVIELILSQENCDVDPINRIAKATPLHLALELSDTGLRKYIVESLLDAGADINVPDKHGDTVVKLIPTISDKELEDLLRKSQAQISISHSDVVQDDDDDDGEGSEGSDSD